MEIEGEDGAKLLLKAGVKSLFGRGSGFNTQDQTVSRRHVSFELKPAAAGTERSESDRVYFEVLGRNPVWIKSEPSEKILTFRKSETGEIAAGDRFCVSGHNPIWFTLKRCDKVLEERALDSESELGHIHVSDIDPVKEFGFLVIGKEFDKYTKSQMPDIKQWEWFLDDSTNGDSDDDEDGDKKGRKGLGKKRSRKKGNEDDNDWSVESGDEDKELMVKSKRVMTPTYSTRSKKTKKDTNASSSSTHTKQRGRVDFEDDDDDDETLGGFIVSDEEDKLEEEDESNVEEDLDEDEDEE